MSYCSNCGHSLTEQNKFCPSCGTKVLGVAIKQHLTGYQEKMYKNVAVSLKKEGQNFVTSKAKETLSSYAKNKFRTTESTQAISEIFKPERTDTNEEKATMSSTKKLNKWTWIYVILNGLLIYLGYQSGEVIGVLLFSVLILSIIFLRRKKENPYNWLVKIILVIQLIFLVALIVERLTYISTITLLLIGLLLTDLILLFKGNNS
ncbi:MAG: zinc ribbon domain-containing protein [Lutibacter sp.]|jgi:uncharacterized Zn finger protein (UPF0148 family)